MVREGKIFQSEELWKKSLKSGPRERRQYSWNRGRKNKIDGNRKAFYATEKSLTSIIPA